MTHLKRRKFLQYSTAFSGTATLAACGGGGSSADASADASALDASRGGIIKTPATPAPAPAPVATPAPAPVTPVSAPAPVAATPTLGLYTGAMQFNLLSSKTQTRAPFALGFSFRRGDVPAGSTVVASAATLQVTPRSTWPDGSLKIAQLAGFADLTAGVLLAVRLSVQSGVTPAPAALGLSDLKATGVTADFDAGTLGKASFAAADWDAPHTTWVSGAQMSSWVFRKPVGSDAHLVAWLEVRLFAGGAVEILPWIENGYLLAAGPTNKAATYTFSLNGKSRFAAAIDLPHHCRTPLISGTALSYWLGTDPDVTPRHDLAYLQATELVPTYSGRVPTTGPAPQGLAAQFTPLGQGNFNYEGDYMPATGYQEPIGLLPQHDALYLTCESSNAYAAVVRNGYAAGRYPLHYRDGSTQRPLRFTWYPNLVLHEDSRVSDIGSSRNSAYTPKPSGTLSPKWDCAHSPSVGFMAYLVTGRFYFMEQVQFAATLDYLTKGDNDVLRNGAQNLVQACYGAWQTRASAWQWRTLVQALTVTPDSDSALRQEFVTCVQTNIDHYHGRYVAQTNNPFGWVQPGEGYQNDMQFLASWQQDFVTAAFGYSLSMGLPIASASATKLDAFFRWKARSAVMRLGTSAGFWYVNAVNYTMSITAAGVPDFTGGKGPWYPNDAAVYAASYAAKPAWFGSTEGTLAGEIMPGDRSFWGNLMTAMAYAVRHGVSGAAAGYQRVTSATNYAILRDAFNVWPVWSVAPARVAPAWMADKPVNQWFEIPNTAGAGGSAVDAYSGMAVNELTNEILIACAGGHMDSFDNRVVSINLSSDSPAWVQRMAPSATTAQNVAYYADGKPASRHTYSSLHFVPEVNRLMLFGARAVYGAAYDYAKVDAFNLDTNKWDAAGTWADMPAGYGAARVRTTGEIISTALQKWSPVDRKWTSLTAQTAIEGARWPMAFDSRRGAMFCLQWGDGQGFDPLRMVISRITMPGGVQTLIKFNASAALTQWLAEKPSYAAMEYDPDGDRFVFYSGQGDAAGRFYVITPNDTDTWDMGVMSMTGSVKINANDGHGIHNRLKYVPALRGFVLLVNAASNLYFMRTA